jgi:hypothetical protein
MDIIDVPTEAIVGVALVLTGTVEPSHATYQNITWKLGSAGTTGAAVSSSRGEFSALSSGLAIVTASIENGISAGVDYEQSFYITVKSDSSGVGIVETDKYPSLRVYPNPTTGQITIECRDALQCVSTGEYTIYNIMGQIVMQGTLPCRDATHCVSTVDVESLAKGMYYLKIEGKTVKIIKN